MKNEILLFILLFSFMLRGPTSLDNDMNQAKVVTSPTKIWSYVGVECRMDRDREEREKREERENRDSEHLKFKLCI